MASEPSPVSPPAPPPAGSPPRDAVEHQDQSIKVRKSQLFEPSTQLDGTVLRPFTEYLRTTPAAPLSAGVRGALWAAGVLVVLLFLAAMLFGLRSRTHVGRTEPAAPVVGLAQSSTRLGRLANHG